VIVVWDLFGGGNNSVSKALDPNKYEIYTFDILNGFDLTKEFKTLQKEYFSKVPKPDIIVASPPCESFSGADCAGRIYNKDLSLKTYSDYEFYNHWAKPNKRRNFYQKNYSRLIGELLVMNTIRIIVTYEPEYWYIENPQSSYIWKYIDKYYGDMNCHNLAWYGSYNQSFSKKPTIFMSNVGLNLKKEKQNWSKEYMLKNSYKNRSAIPPELIQDIFKQFGGNNA